MEAVGIVAPGFEAVREAFEEVLATQPGTGAGFAARQERRWLADLWGGHADAGHSRPWEADTLVMPYSVTKPFAAACVLVLVERGQVDLDAPMQRYWPELEAAATVRDVLAHRAGLVALDEPAPEEALYDWDRLCRLLEQQAPSWPPGTAQGESALFYGHLLGEVVRRVDGRSLGRFLRDEVCRPHELDFHVGLGPEELGRVADLTGLGPDFRRTQERDSELYRRAMSNPPGLLDPDVVNSRRWREAEVPAVNGHGTARAVARFYERLAGGLLLAPGVLAEMTSVGSPSVDRVMGGEPRTWGLGVDVEPEGYGMAGTGGSVGWWCEDGGYAAAFLTGHVGGHERAERVENSLRAVLGLDPL